MDDFFELQERLRGLFAKRLLLVVGPTRWGTAWVQSCLDAHADICAKGEGHFTDILFPRIAKAIDEYNAECEKIGNRLQLDGLPGNAAGYTFDDVDFLLRTAVGLMFERWAGHLDVACIAEKTPEHVLGLGVLDRVLPGARVIHVVRDGRDEAVSAWEFNRRISRGDFFETYPEFADYAGVFASAWNRSVGTAKHFARRNPARCLEIRCEDIIEGPIRVAAQLFEFSGFDLTPAALRNCTDAAWDSSPLDVEPGTWETMFDLQSSRVFKRDCGELLKLLGYEL